MAQRLPVLNATKIIRALMKAGFFIHHTSGSHAHLKHPNKPGFRVTIPRHPGDVPPSILRSILKQAGLTVEEFITLL